MPKITAQLAMDLNLCYNQEEADAAHAASGSDPDGVTVDELLTGKWLEYDDAMFMVCREEVTPVKVLRDFAAAVARQYLPTVTKGLPSSVPFIKAVNFLEEGDADDRPEELAEHSECVQKFMVSALVIEGTGDWTEPDKIAAYETLLGAAKVIRAALKPNAGESAYASAHHAYILSRGKARDELGRKLRHQLAKVFKAQS